MSRIPLTLTPGQVQRLQAPSKHVTIGDVSFDSQLGVAFAHDIRHAEQDRVANLLELTTEQVAALAGFAVEG